MEQATRAAEGGNFGKQLRPGLAPEHGAVIDLLPPRRAWTYGELDAAAAEYRCTHLSGIPTMFALMARQQELIATLDLSSVKAVTIGSAPLTEALVQRVQAMFPQAAISNGYGTTEAGPSIFEDHPGGLPRPLLSLGYPLREVEVRLVGGTEDEGVLQVRSPAMFTEYLNLPKVTAEKLHDAG